MSVSENQALQPLKPPQPVASLESPDSDEQEADEAAVVSASSISSNDNQARRPEKVFDISNSRRREIQRAAQAGVNNWRKENAALLSLSPIDWEKREPAVRTIPHPKRMVQIKRGDKGGIPQLQSESFKAGIFRTVLRVFVWLYLGMRLLMGNLWDIVRRRNSIERSARRLRLVLQAGGATFIKLGQQLSLRIDILPHAYATELENMLDRVEPFPFEQALGYIKEAVGGSIEDTFAALDPVPIGSASMSCVYHAVLHSGERVAVKVRRPGIGDHLAADMRALGWLMQIAELFVFPPGFTRNFVSELSNMLMAELDMRMEARQQDIFRRRVRKAKMNFVTAPKIRFEYSNHCVITQEFVSGVWLTDLLSVIENDDEESLAILRQNGIYPRKVAQRLLRITRWSAFEDLFFHADLHPANVLVSKGSKLILIDFGSCGAFTKSEILIWRRIMYAQHNDDVGSMAQASISLLEPLPPVDYDELTKKVEAIFWDHLYAYKDKNAEWWEKTSAHVWIKFLALSQEMHIPMNLNTLKMIRATMLVDTLALRLDHSIDQYKEFSKYLEGAGERTRKRLRKKIRELFKPAGIVDAEELFDAGRNFIYRLKRSADTSILATASLVGKAAYVAALGFQFVMVTTVVAVLFGMVISYQYMDAGIPLTMWGITMDIATNTYFHIIVIVLALAIGRRVIYRLRDKEGAG